MSRLSAVCHYVMDELSLIDMEKSWFLPDRCLQNRNSSDTWRIPLWLLHFGPNLDRMNESYCRYIRLLRVDIENQYRYHAQATVLRGQTSS